MSSVLDLHMHSLYSDDGEFAPRQLMMRCRDNGVKVAAMADHNCTRGVAQAMEYAENLRITLIPAVELDCTCLGVGLHVLGYWIDPDAPGFLKQEVDILRQERAASRRRVELVENLGLELDHQKLAKLANRGVITGEAIAEVALSMPENKHKPLLAPYRSGGDRADNPYVNFYWDICSQGKPAYVPIHYFSLEDAVDLIRKSGGVPILAHPGVNVGTNKEMLREIARNGVAGVEVYSSYHTPEQTAFYLEQARALDLIVTCGSDFHGKTKPKIEVGCVNCDGLEEEIFHRLLENRPRVG